MSCDFRFSKFRGTERMPQLCFLRGSKVYTLDSLAVFFRGHCYVGDVWDPFGSCGIEGPDELAV